jgi:hypothetical protein
MSESSERTMIQMTVPRRGGNIADAIWNVLWLDHLVERWAEPDQDTTIKSPKWRKFSPEVRDRYTSGIDAAITTLRRVRAALAARDWRTCEECAVRFVGDENARYDSDGCRQTASSAGNREARVAHDSRWWATSPGE